MPDEYQIIGYDKDNDVELVLATHPSYQDAKRDINNFWYQQTKDENVRNLHGQMSMQQGEPLDWLIIRHEGDDDEVIGFY